MERSWDSFGKAKSSVKVAIVNDNIGIYPELSPTLSRPMEVNGHG